jgi:hypothetical protein
MTGKHGTVFGRLAIGSVAFALAWGVAGTAAYAQAPLDSQARTSNQASSNQTLSEKQLEQLAAPIALYPDPLLMQVLMASTYPLEVVEAARWSQANSGVAGIALQAAMQQQSWDPSVKALTAVPQTLQMMSDELDWMQQLGDALLAQQQELMDAIQKLRAEAQAAGNLQSNAQQRVTIEPAPGNVASSMQQAIVIQPADPNVYYVPVYDPSTAYGTWSYPANPPFFWSPPGFVASNIVSFAAGVAVGAAIWGGCNWWQHSVVINVNRFNAFNHANIVNTSWTHDPAHRGGMPYHNVAMAARFGQFNPLGASEMPKNHNGRADVAHALDSPVQAAKATSAANTGRHDPGINMARPAPPSRAAMSSRRPARPMITPRPQLRRPRMQSLRAVPHAFGHGEFAGRFGAGWHHL